MSTLQMRIESYGYSFSKKKKSISKNDLLNKQQKYKMRRFSTRIKHQKRNNSKRLSQRYKGERTSGQKALMGDVDIPPVEQVGINIHLGFLY